MNDLNPTQMEAVQYLNGPLLVIAGAGSGKTNVISRKIFYLIQQCGISPSNIVAVTFTNKAAREMKERVQRIAGKHAEKLRVSTFHTLGLNIIKHQHALLGLKAQISIFDTEDCLTLLRELLCQDTEEHKEKLEIYLKMISHWKGMGWLPEEAYKNSKNPFEIAAVKVYDQYQHHLKTYNAVDFDDLIFLPLQLLKQNLEVREIWQNRIRYLLVDEYQDTNHSQYELVRLLTGAPGRFTVVGDDHQSIYAFRGAKPDNLLSLTRDYSNLKLIKLEQNYRSSGTILKAANHLIGFNSSLFSKNLWSSFPRGELIKILYMENEEQEAQKVVLSLLSHKLQDKSSFSNYAILYRSNHQSRIFEKTLREHQIPYQLSGGTSFFSRTEIKDIMAYLKLLVNPDDDCAFLRIVNTPKREIGPATLEKLSSYAKSRNISLFAASFEMGLEQFLSVSAVERLRNFTHWITLNADNAIRGNPLLVIKDMVKHIKYEQWLIDIAANPHSAQRKWENVQDLMLWLERLLTNEEDNEEKTLASAVNSMVLMDILEHSKEEKTQEAVQLMTLHAAKGLEFPVVYIVGLEEEILPHRTSIEENSIEEERRLLYVGLTRAKQLLTLSLAKQRKRFNQMLSSTPSRFLEELPKDCVAWEEEGKVVSEADRASHGKKHLELIRGLLS